MLGGIVVKKKIGQGIQRHVEEHASLYIFIAILFFMGIVFGTLIVQSLGYNQRSDLFYYFQQFLLEIEKDHFVDPRYALYQNFVHYLKYTGVIWILGLSIIGLPIILIMLFLKGVFIGFTIGFLVHQLGSKGFLFSLVSIIPQNMIVVPIILAMSVVSISFSSRLIAHLFGANRYQHKPNIPKYIGTMVIVTFIILAVSVFQTYVSPLMMKMVA